jgi:hypothetical protein
MTKMFSSSLLSNAFVIDVDFTVDLKLGFEPELLFEYLKE